MKFDLTKAAAIALVLTLSGTAFAQDYPAKSIRMLVGFAPGGGTDIIGRIVGQKLSETLG